MFPKLINEINLNTGLATQKTLTMERITQEVSFFTTFLLICFSWDLGYTM